MMDAKARQDCVKEIGLLKVSGPEQDAPLGAGPSVDTCPQLIWNWA